MEFFKANLNIDFMGKRAYMAVMSVILIAISLSSLVVRQLNLGLDFTGGTLLEVSYPQPVGLTGVRAALTKAGFPDAVVQHLGNAEDLLARIPPHGRESSAQLSTRAMAALSGVLPGVEPKLRRVEFVGPQVGHELAEKGGLAMLYALIGILIYVAMRFEWRLALGAVLATVHDTLFTLGFFSLFHIDFNLTVLAAVLAVIGYSLNDTIVVFDRIRENFRRMRKGSPVEIMNASINQTLSRTIMTSSTTMLVVVALFFFGGEVVHGFALALIVGIVIGTFSSIYVASPLALWLGVSKADLMPARKEQGDSDGRHV
ncbi:MAG: protein translocase subunit SecF [Chromatiales bacterium 21-64-14]|nr:MAG: protein translocase subunit SecF [Chromatiales bacterium 21-64-14]HQU15041.1 protein translocase subunit SecF [Gammaproteobacteria bacterium]